MNLEHWNLMPYCVECDNPLEEIGDAFEHPMYEGEIVCESCRDTIKKQLEVCV